MSFQVDTVKGIIIKSTLKIRGNMEKYSIAEVIEQAVRAEKLGYEFYTRMTKRFKKDNQLQSLFKTLAEKELQHEKTFSDLKAKVKNEEPEGWEEVSEYLRAIVESEFFLGKKKSLPSLEHVKSAAGAVKFALGFEKETLLYYYAVREAVKEEDIVDGIIDEEKKHIVWLSEFKGRLKK